MIPIGLLLIVCISVAVIVLIARRKGWIFSYSRFQRAGDFMPTSAPPASRASRVAETIVLAIIAIIILAISATWPSTGGYLLMLDQLRPDYARANVIMFICAVIGAVIAISIALRGRTAAGAIVLAVVLIAYGFVLNGGRYPGSWFLSEEMAMPTVEYSITLSDCNVEGAELWVNGVFLGKTPYTTTLDEFEAKVPYWPKPPADYETNKVEIRDQPDGSSIYRRWIVFEIPTRFPSRSANHSEHGKRSDQERRQYYAKVRYAGEWGLAEGGSGWSGSGSGPAKYRASSHISVIFPERQKRLDTLLNMARLGGYRVGPEWFKAIETYNGDGWIALRLAAEKEPRMMEVLDAWATWRYGLEKAIDADSAWRVFQNICDEAEARREYCTPSTAGRAVELLSPKLPRARLVDRAVELIRNADAFSYLHWNINGRLQFGYTERPGGLYLGSTGPVTFNSTGGRYGAPRFPVSGYPIMHAIWLLNEHLRSAGQPEPNVVQQRIVPAIVGRRENSQGNPMLVAAYFGGPAIDKFLLRQPWGIPPDPLDFNKNFMYVSGRKVNKWLYYLTCLNDDAGRKFRREHADQIMAIAEIFCNEHSSGLPEGINFIFMDPWLAKEYWPRFMRLARQKPGSEPLETQWKYLSRMGDAATVEMFVEAWKGTQIDISDNRSALRVLDKLDIPLRRKVIDAVVRQVRTDAGNLTELSKYIDQDREISMLESHDPQLEADRTFAELQKGLQQNTGTSAGVLGKHLPFRLAHTRPDSPLVSMLVNADKPEMRLLAVDALREYPIPRHQELLKKLLQDPDATVRAAAEKVSQELKELAAQKPSELASDAASAPSTPSATSTTGEKG